MSPTDPADIQQLLAQARQAGQWYCGQPDAAARCYDVLALLPDHAEASALIYELFCDEWLIYDNRNALQQNIDEWDDRPHQQRRRLALSFGFMSRWEKRHFRERGPAEVRDLLDEGKGQLLMAYCLGDEECTDYAWPLFQEAIEKAKNPQAALLWVGHQYADLGFFADAVEVLAELCSRYDDAEARRLLAEVKWWRDNAYRLPWIPPPGDGSRYQRMMSFIDPAAPTQEQIIEHLREQMGERHPRTWQPTLNPDLAALVASALDTTELKPPVPSIVDWSFLDTDDGQPGELPEWAKKQMRLFRHNPEIVEHIAQERRWSRPIPPPATPPRHDPDEEPFDPAEFMANMEDEFDFDEEEEDEE